jgi:thiosulfate/3-mercaptopyruvate sulfurtransferase
VQSTDYFISAEYLKILMTNERDLRLIDVQFVLGDSVASYELYKNQHLPEAIYLSLEEDLSGGITNKTGRHPLPDLSNFIELLHLKGLHIKYHIVIYDNYGGGAAARLWWMLRFLGYNKISILNGGINSWIELGYEVTNVIPNDECIDYIGFIPPNSWSSGKMKIFTLSQVEEFVDSDLDSTIALIDSREADRYYAKSSLPDKIPGRIPKSLNLPWKSNLSIDNHLKSESDLSKIFKDILPSQKELVFSCGSGVTACFNLLIAEMLGYDNLILYPGSYSEWERNKPEKIEK